MLALVSVALFFIPNETLVSYMGEGSGIKGWVTAAAIGSIALIPGFVAYPLCGILINSGVSYSVIAVFITTLMMTGFIMLPLEAKFFGWRTSIIRNTTDHLKAQVTCLKAGNSIPPCKMENDVLFYFLTGEGTITVDNETTKIKSGDCVVVPHQADSRSILAKTDLGILAVQGLK